MLAFPGMLVDAAKQAGIKTPPNPDDFSKVKDEYPHFYVFCELQLGHTLYNGMTSHWDNAKIIADIPDDKIRTITCGEIYNLGFI
jgi:hypothetical protein